MEKKPSNSMVRLRFCDKHIFIKKKAVPRGSFFFTSRKFCTFICQSFAMKKIIAILFLLPFITLAQVTEDFSDGDFTSNPVWTGDTADFKISTYSNSSWSQQPRLQLDGTVAGISHARLATPLSSLNNMEWNFWTRLAFGTSSSNNCRVYLVSDNEDLEGSLNGYFVMFGDDSNDALDSISLCKQSGTTITKLIHGHYTKTSASRNYRVKVTRDAAGLWELAVDTSGLTNYLSEGSAIDASYTTSVSFGVFCRYTLTNKTNFYFDDIYVGPQVVDTVPPTVLSLNCLSATEIDVIFSENVLPAGGENTTNYFAAGLGNPATAVLDPGNASLVHLVFTTAFIPGQVYSLEVTNVADLANNVMAPASVPFSWYTAQPYDVVFNEVMADPDPPVGLPSVEYLELYNRAGVPISLRDWTLRMGTTTVTLPDISLAAHSWLILTGQGNVASLSPYGLCAGLSSFSLTNAGTSLVLSDAGGNEIHAISYTSSWYHDPSKSGGGWSIEQIDPDNPCAGESNWTASVSVLGGTPGSINSVYAPNPDLLAPRLVSVVPGAGNSLTVYFSETISPAVLSNVAVFSVEPAGSTPLSALPGGDLRSVRLNFAAAFDPETVYTLYLNDTLSDCAGNFSAGDSLQFSLYQPKQFEVLINEIMADPEPVVGLPAMEYIELYNRTQFPISLRKYTLLAGTSLKNLPDVSIPAQGYMILCPAGYGSAFQSYGFIAEVDGLALTNSGTTLVLLDSLHHALSTVSYNDTWYQNQAKAGGGWSLEQVDPLNPCGDAANWRASNDVSGGTPGRLNSVAAPNPDQGKPTLLRASVNRFQTSTVRLFFSEPIDSTTLLNPANYSIDNGIGQPTLVKLIPPDYAGLTLTLPVALQSDLIYTLTLTDTVTDCAGNPVVLPASVRFAIPVVADSGDVVINEVLSDPWGDGVDFVELVNRSNKVFDLGELYLADWDTLSGVANELFAIAGTGFLIFPGEYAALSTDPEQLQKAYPASANNPAGFVRMSDFPSLSNDEGVVTICNQAMTVLDQVVYSADMHFSLLNSTEGISLERISFNRPSRDKTNWHSAAETVGYSTPALVNSQYSEATADDGAVQVSPEIFSPDNSGYNDVLNISYTFDEPGFIANISIYDNNGRRIRQLVRNALLGTTGTYCWDGTTDEGEKATIGIYIIYFEVYNAAGDLKRYKKAAVLAQRMK